MARPQAEDYAAKQQVIRDRAAELFAARGFAATSISDIAAACNCAKSLIYHYFGSKEDILFDLLKAHVEALYGAARAALDQESDPEARFRAFVRALLDLYAHARAKHILLLNELDNLPPSRKGSIVALERQLVELAADLFEGLAPGLGKERMLRIPIAMSFYGMINWTYTWYRPGGPLSPRRFADLAADLFLRGMPAAIERFTGQPDGDATEAVRGRNESVTMRSAAAFDAKAAATQSSTKAGEPATSTTCSDKLRASRVSSKGMRPRSQGGGAASSRVRVTR
jgi:Transcriptional regulator